ncbi:helix-turn-helix transcriptional regulator [Streptomyces tagetis]|uniref:AlpA family phage regulatory protein n=1 Tax=Streptomyces tagetis TaxID=2820809 RepID=A0A940XFX7_9ACTN|nr:AlpA family phage regulatory protein [Streptomyces sp. RG38]MBQ0827685.1 AlpA family phage regulatory protein [Streptomyces sp. RG38]
MITLKQIEQEHGIGRSSLHNYRRRPTFPQPVPVEGSTKILYRADEVAAWFDSNPPQQGKRTDLAPQDEGADMPIASPATDRAALIDAAAALLLAAITMRDLASAMAPAAFTSMPDDIRGRVMRHGYQQAFDRLPADVRAEAHALVDADPDIIAARNL